MADAQGFVKFQEVRFELDQETYRKLAKIARAKRMSLRKTLLPAILRLYAQAQA